MTDTVNPVSSSEHIDLGENAFGEDSVPHSDPIPYNENNTFTYGIVIDESWRNRRSLSDTSFAALSISLYKYPLQPLETAKIFIDFSKLPQTMIYNVHF